MYRDFIWVLPNELNVKGFPLLFAGWGMDIIGPIEPLGSNGNYFIFVTIDYFIKKVKDSTHKALTIKVIEDFIRNNLVYQFGILESIIIDNGANINSKLMREVCEKFKISYRNSTAYRSHMNGAVNAANKNIKGILRKIVDDNKECHRKLPYAFLGYRITIRTSTSETPYILVYSLEEVIPTEVEIP